MLVTKQQRRDQHEQPHTICVSHALWSHVTSAMLKSAAAAVPLLLPRVPTLPSGAMLAKNHTVCVSHA
jgi:hypothetical protein